MRIAHFLFGRCKSDSANGVEQVVYNLTRHLALLGNDVALFSLTGKPPLPVPGVEVKTYSPERFLFRLPTDLLNDLRKWRPDVVHLHSVYSPWNVSMAAWLLRNHIPYVTTPHGGLSPHVSKRHLYLKAPYRLLFELRCQNRAEFVHAVSQHEVVDIQNYGVRRPIEVIPNGFDPSQLPVDLDRTLLSSRFPQIEGKRVLVFLGRLDPHCKGLDLFLAGFAAVTADRVCAVLIGPDWHGSRDRLEELTKELGISDRVIFAGSVYGAERYHLLSGADIFVHTSRWEGLPLAVLEACAIGLPCLVTSAANPNDKLGDYRGGLIVDPAAAEIAHAIREMLALSPDDLRELGQHAKRMVELEFSWPTISENITRAYRAYAYTT